MLELHTLGVAGLRAPDGAELRAILAQPKRLALLTYLALARPGRPHRRDSLLAVFWPEFDADRARAALRDSLYFLRRHLGDVIVSRGADDVGIDPGRLRVDALRFQDALREHRFADAVELYAGDLLTGFNLPSAPEFESWLDNERIRLRALAADAACDAGDAAADRPAEAARWYRRALELEPYQESALNRLIDLLERTGDHAGAVAAYEQFASRLARELEISPSEATRVRVEKLRTAPAPLRPLPRRPRPDVIDIATRARDAAAPAPDRTIEYSTAARPAPTRASPPNHLWRLLPVAALIAQIALLPVAWRSEPDTVAAPAPEPADIVVLPFTVHGDAQYLGEGIIDLIGAKLDGLGGVRTVDPQALFTVLGPRSHQPIDLAVGRTVATRFQAQHFVMGTVVQAGPTIQVSAYLYDSNGRQIARADQLGAESEIIPLVDGLARQLLAGQLGGHDQMSALAARTTASLPALREYLDGERHFRRGDFARAVESLQRAVSLDTTFALAYYRLSSAADRVGRGHIAEPAARAAFRHRGRLPQHPGGVVAARHEYWFGDAALAEKLYLQLTATQPKDAELFYELAELRYYAGPWIGRPLTGAESALRRVLELNPQHLPALLHLGRIAAATRRPLLLDSLLRNVERDQPHSTALLELRALLLAMSGVPDAIRPVIAASEQSADGLRAIADRVALYTGNFVAAEQIARAQLAFAAAPEGRALALQTLTQVLAAQARWREARQQLRELGRLQPGAAAQLRARLATSLATTTPVSDIAEAEHALLALATDHDDEPAVALDASAAQRLYYLGLLASRRNEALAENYARALDHLSGDSISSLLTRSLAGTLRARLLAARGDTAAALRTLEDNWLPPRKQLLSVAAAAPAQIDARLLRAELLLALRRYPDALAWADAAGEDVASSTLALPRATLVRARALESLGRLADAQVQRELYRRVLGPRQAGPNDVRAGNAVDSH